MSGISCEETKENQALEEMIGKGKVSDHKSSEAKGKKRKKSSCRGTQKKPHEMFTADKEKENREYVTFLCYIMSI